MRKVGLLFLVVIVALICVPNHGFSSTNIYLSESSGHQLDWEYTETPPKRPKPKILNSAYYEAKWKMDNPLLFSLVQDKDGILYTTDSDNNVHAVYPNGKRKWTLHLDMGFELSVIYLKLGQDGTIYAYSSDSLSEPSLTSIYALSPEGKVIWKLQPSTIYSRFDYHFAGDSLGNFVYFTEEGLVSRNAKGEINWINKAIQTSDPSKYLESLHHSNVYTDLAGNIYVDSANKEIISLDAAGNERWRSKPQGYLNAFNVFRPFFSDAGLLYMLTIDGLHALKAADGSAVAITSESNLSDIRSSGIPTDGRGGYYIVDKGLVQKIDYTGISKWVYVQRETERQSIGYIDILATDDKGNVYFPTGVGNIFGLNSEGQEIFAFLRNSYWYIISEVVVGRNGNIYSSNMDIGLLAFGKKQIQVYVDNLYLPLPVAPIKENGTVSVPFRSLFESLGLTVSWDSVSQTITGSKDGLSIQMTLGSTTALVNGQAKQLTVAPKVTNNSTYVPLRFVGEALGKDVSWDSKSSSVNINSRT
ncbi:stalk domain-containing protein [Paenibacillus sp. CF384]|uniref:stalk domain-containing protein n=1 Tax=Paenibacillus sp. CF384 TaxID=1884382 RepID=UPI000899B7CB|nr:stalk domain-containing protein [Paenibacillus sp. CF384]SDX55300.1 Copper amine oxidase N-terminal domain-containing protein [Paenibacillus sp. CF384]